MSKFAYFSEELQLSTPFFVKKKEENYQEKKGFYWQSKHTIKKVAKFGILSKGLVDGFVEILNFFIHSFRQKKAKKKYLWPIQKKTFFIDNKPL